MPNQKECHQFYQGFKGHHGDQALMAFHGIEMACAEDNRKGPQEQGHHQLALYRKAQQ